jgi:uncharacterized protein YyaL (SSP411 family)
MPLQHQPNRLIRETSPYLLEHAHNPVDWFAWGDEALQKARDENKPLIISIGYAACHWCHVMEHQSFSDVEVANFMNRHFVCIKIDREERPDIDKIYMDAVQILTGSGGWPLNAFALPNGQPFYGGTYFPKAQWMQLLQQLVEVWQLRSNDILEQAGKLSDYIQQSDWAVLSDQHSDLANLYNRQLIPSWASLVDTSKGGFNGAPKFVLPVAWEFLLQYYGYHQSPWALKVVQTTLSHLFKGGINDHLLGGFARYSVDADWHVPHFEKMLYDNGQLLSLYAHAHQCSRQTVYVEAIQQMVRFLKADLLAPNHCFHASVNADSEGEEGKFYVWMMDEVKEVLPPHLLAIVVMRYNLSLTGNWEHGLNILDIAMDATQIAEKTGLSLDETSAQIDRVNELLLQSRNKRIKPTIDDKILVSWNALAIKGLVDAYLALGDDGLLQMAIAAAQTISATAMDGDGHLFHNLKNNQPAIDGFLEDYAFLAQAYIQLYQATFDDTWLHTAHRLANYALANFSAEGSPLLYFTSAETPHLIARKSEVTDNVTPSSNAVMAEVLLKLGAYFRNPDWEERAFAMVQSIAEQTVKSGPYYGKWNQVMGLLAHGLAEITIVGDDRKALAVELQRHFLPGAIVVDGHNISLPISENVSVLGGSQIQICKNGTCHLPVATVGEALLLLGVDEKV